MDRINQIVNNMNLSENQAIIIFSQINRYYYSGFPSSDGVVLITKDCSYLFVDFRYFEAAEKIVKNMSIVLYEDFKKTVIPILEKLGIKQVFSESYSISLHKANTLSDMLSEVNIKLISNDNLEDTILKQREIKSADEIEKIKKAQSITDKAFEYALNNVRVGMSEKELALDIEFFMRKNGADGIAFDFITVFGKNTSLPHGVPSDKLLQHGELITLDMGALYGGYCSDMTRTFAIGECSKKQRDVYDTVLLAQEKALAEIKSGVKCSDIDKVARDVIYSAGFEGCFGHATGHSLGLEIHEKPAFSPKSNDILSAGTIMTVEPGIYLKNKFGVRIEDMILVTEYGIENLTKSPKDLIIV